MVIVGENLHLLYQQHNITNRSDSFDNTCLKIKLGKYAKKYVAQEGITALTYTQEIPSACMENFEISNKGLFIPSKTAILACSLETINMPMGYMGLLQTKGSLARLLVSLHFSDGQIDSGYQGTITFEIFNASIYDIVIPLYSPIGNLYILKTSTKNNGKYNGRYQNAIMPTHSLPDC